jgi:hypothetical protein
MLDPLLAANFGEVPKSDTVQMREFYDQLGLYTAPDLRLQVTTPSEFGEIENLRVSPLQLVLAFATLNNNGIRPAPRVALAVNTPAQGWVILPANIDPLKVLEETKAQQTADSLRVPDKPFWQFGSISSEKEKSFTWFVAGTLPNWQGTPLTLVVLLEENNAPLANSIGEALLIDALEP